MTDAFDLEAPGAYGDLWADVYHDEHRFLVPPEAQLSLLEELASGRRALELGIGTGRVALPLARRGVDVAGVDASPAMVERLRTKDGGSSIEVKIADMATLPVEGGFGLVYVVFNTVFGLLSQSAQVACFASVARLLEPGGYFCVECFVPDLTRFQGGQALRTVRLGLDEVRIDASQHDPVHQRISANVIGLGKAGISVRPVRLRYAWPAELDLMAQLAGLRLRSRRSDWERRPFTADSTNHVTVYELAP